LCTHYTTYSIYHATSLSMGVNVYMRSAILMGLFTNKWRNYILVFIQYYNTLALHCT